MKKMKISLAGLAMLCAVAGCRKYDSMETGTPPVEQSTFSTYASGKKVTNIINPGGDFWYNTNNFNQEFGLNPGDTVVLKAGTYGHIDITHIDGITFINDGQVIIDSWNFNKGAKNVKVLGSGTPGLKYGIKFNGKNNFAARWFATGDLELSNIEVDGTIMGFQVKTLPTETYPLNTQNLVIHDCLIQNTKQEAIYAGADELGGPFIYGKIYNVIVKNTGRDGIQVRNGSFEVYDNQVSNVGGNNESGHTHGILFGGNSKNGVARNNKVSGVPNGYGLFINGYGNYTVECNDISSANSAIFTKNYEYREDLQNVGYQNFTVRNNTLASSVNKAIESAYNNNGIKTTLSYSGNRSSGQAYVMSGISFTQSNNGASVVPVCTSTPPAPSPDPEPEPTPDPTPAPDPTPTPQPSEPVSGSTTRIEAENYSAMSGLQLVTSGSTKYMGSVDVADWLDFSINPATSGTYTVKLNVATPNSGKQLQIRNASGSVLATVNIPQGRWWGDWKSVTANISLTAGSQKLRVYANTNAWDIDWIEITGMGGSSPSPTPAPTPTVNQAPSANAGSDKTITLPVNSLTLSGSGTDADGSISAYQWTKLSGPSAVISSASSAATLVAGLSAGTYTFQLRVTDNKGATATDNVTVTVNSAIVAPPPAFSTIKVEAEDYVAMKGIAIVSSGSQKFVGHLDNGDWMDYNVNISAAGTYTISLRIATPQSGRQLQIRNESGSVLSTVNVPKARWWGDWMTVTTTVTLPAGSQKLRIYSNAAPWDLDYFEIKK